MVYQNDDEPRTDAGTGEAPAPESSPQPNPQLDEDAVINPWSRMVAVITDPVAAMKGVMARGGWIAPFILAVIAVLLMYFLAGDVMMEIGREQAAERIQAMVDQGRIDQQQADQILDQQMNSSFTQVMMVVGPIVSMLIIRLIIAVLALVVGNIVLGAARKFGNYWSLAWYAGVIGAVSMIVASVVMSITGDMQSANFGLGILTASDPQSTLHKIFAVFNVFTLWEAVVAGIGVSLFAKVSRPKGIIWMLVLYIAFGLITSLLAGQPMV